MVALPKGASAVHRFNQEELFDIPIKGSRVLALLVGDYYGALVTSVLGGELLSIDNTYGICPDVFVPDDGSVVEVKASESSNYFKLSKQQYFKYKSVFDDGIGVYYCFMVYSGGGKMRPVFKNLPKKIVQCAVEFLASSTVCMLLVDFGVVRKWVPDLFYDTEWGCSGTGRGEVPDELRGIYKVTVKSVKDFCFDPVGFLQGIDLDVADFLIQRTDVVGASIGGVEVCRFPFVKISQRDRDVSGIGVDLVPWVRDQAISLFNLDNKEVPF